MKFRTRWRAESDQWTVDGEKITDPDKQKIIEDILDKSGPILLEHRYYRGASGPSWHIFTDKDDLIQYLESKASAGDAIFVWNLENFILKEPPELYCKCPAEDGTVPKYGAY